MKLKNHLVVFLIGRWRLLLFAVLSTGLLSGCAVPILKTPDSDASSGVVSEPGNELQKAESLQELAEGLDSEEQVIDLLLQAANHFIAARAQQRAENILDQINQMPMDYQQMRRWQQLQSEIWLYQGEINQADAMIDQLKRFQTSGEQPELLRLEALSASRKNQPGKALQLLIQRDYLLENNSQRQENRSMIWRLLTHAKALPDKTWPETMEETASGWIELARIAREQQEASNITHRVEQWRSRFYHHPGQIFITQLIGAASSPASPRIPDAEVLSVGGRHMAVILPLSGSYAPIGHAVQRGFMAAFYQHMSAIPNDISEETGPFIVFYDSAGDPAQALKVYHQAIEQGAFVVVGPLIKASVASIIEDDGISPDVEIITLNEPEVEQAQGGNPVLTQQSDATRDVPGIDLLSLPANIHVFSPLNPESHARQIVEYASRDGCRNAMILAPESEWGQKVQYILSSHFQKLGGNIIAAQTFLPKSYDFTRQLGMLLGTGVPGRKSHVVRLHLPADSCVLVGTTSLRETALINSQLDYFDARRIPVYAMPITNPDSKVPRDLLEQSRGVKTVLLAWNAYPQRYPSRAQLERAWAENFNRYSDVYAMGYDSFMLAYVITFRRGSDSPWIMGTSGELHWRDHPVVFTKLIWSAYTRHGIEPVEAIY